MQTDVDGFGFHPMVYECAWTHGEWERLKIVKARRLGTNDVHTNRPMPQAMKTRGRRIDYFIQRRRAEFLGANPHMSEDELYHAVNAAIDSQIIRWEGVRFPPIPESA